MNQIPDPSHFADDRPIAAWSRPSRLSDAIFRAKVGVFRVRRTAIDLVSGVERLGMAGPAGFSSLLADIRSPLWSDERLAERVHQLGKVENLRRAARSLNGTLLDAGATFSFWKQVGRASARRGYVTGRMLQGGCLVPATGGGLCQISNALYNLALDSGCEIVERHAHSRIVPGSASTAGRDATVAWNYVDLRFRSPRNRRLEVRLSHDELIVRLWGQAGDAIADASPRVAASAPTTASPGDGPSPRSCATCDETGCFRQEARPAVRSVAGVKAWLVDDNLPEFQTYLGETAQAGDRLGLPLDGARWRLGRYRWETSGFERIIDASVETLRRSWAMRAKAASGPVRRAAEMAGAEAIALRLARLLDPEVTQVVVAQSLLPHLWRAGWLGGRQFSVLATRPPMAHLQSVLDAAFTKHPDRASLADFRAPEALVAAEREAMAAAEEIITPHAEVARLYRHKAVLLDWTAPEVERQSGAPGRRIAFAGPTAARKGAWAVREAALALDLEVVLLGSDLEGPRFWDGVKTSRPVGPPAAWLPTVAAVVQPALTEETPRKLLTALAAGRPVLASAACGLGPRPGLRIIAADDAAALITALCPHV